MNTTCHQKQSKLFMCLLVICFYSFATEDSDTVFFNKIEMDIRNAYRTCTNDTSSQPLKKILIWKHTTDSIIKSSKFQTIKKFYMDSHPQIQASPCEIVEWYKRKIISEQNSNNVKLILNSNPVSAEDSIAASKELSKLKASCCDYQKIPFGITKKNFITLSKKAGFPILSDGGDYLCFTNFNEPVFNTLAFYFDKKGRYYRYEIETIQTSIDSLDTYIRFLAEQLSSHFQDAIGTAPDHVNYVGRFEIFQGKLSILNMWTIQNITVYTGIATFNNRYYAKAIVKKNQTEVVKVQK